MWSTPIPQTAPDGSRHHLVLLDTEGIDAYDQASLLPRPGAVSLPRWACFSCPTWLVSQSAYVKVDGTTTHL